METPRKPAPHATTHDIEERNLRLGKVLVGVVVAMFLFGFASIPLYRLVCAQIDPGGSSWYIGDPDIYEGVEIDESREVRIRFATNVEAQLPWEFEVVQNFVTVHPGQKELVEFRAHNRASYPVTGSAVYDINPPAAAAHFKKIECFCFLEQPMEPGQRVEMPLYFWLDPDLPEHVREVTIAYTFFNADSSRTRASQGR